MILYTLCTSNFCYCPYHHYAFYESTKLWYSINIVLSFIVYHLLCGILVIYFINIVISIVTIIIIIIIIYIFFLYYTTTTTTTTTNNNIII